MNPLYDDRALSSVPKKIIVEVTDVDIQQTATNALYNPLVQAFRRLGFEYEIVVFDTGAHTNDFSMNWT